MPLLFGLISSTSKKCFILSFSFISIKVIPYCGKEKDNLSFIFNANSIEDFLTSFVIIVIFSLP